MKIDLKDANQNIGTLVFSTDARQLQAARTAGGMIVWFPAEATFPFLAKGSPNPYLTDVRLSVSRVESKSASAPTRAFTGARVPVRSR